jgi:hypothetical protein
VTEEPPPPKSQPGTAEFSKWASDWGAWFSQLLRDDPDEAKRVQARLNADLHQTLGWQYFIAKPIIVLMVVASEVRGRIHGVVRRREESGD